MNLTTRRDFLSNAVFSVGAASAFPVISFAGSTSLKDENPQDIIEKIADGEYRGSKPWNDCNFYEIITRMYTIVADVCVQSLGKFVPENDRFMLTFPFHIPEVKNSTEMNICEFLHAKYPKCIVCEWGSTVCSLDWDDNPFMVAMGANLKSDFHNGQW